MFDKVLNSPLITSKNSNNKLFFKTVDYLFTKFDYHSSMVHSQFHVTLFSTYLLNNKNYNGVS